MFGAKVTLPITLNAPSPLLDIAVAGTGKLIKLDWKMDGAKYRTTLGEHLLESRKKLRLGQRF